MNTAAQCLILSCGNTLRMDDGIGPFLSKWAEWQFRADARIRVLTCHQWTPELAVDLAGAATALFVDCAVNLRPGEVHVRALEAGQPKPTSGINTHQSGASELLAMARDYYASLPRRSLLLTVGAGSVELGEEFSSAVAAAIPRAQQQIKAAVASLLALSD